MDMDSASFPAAPAAAGPEPPPPAASGSGGAAAGPAPCPRVPTTAAGPRVRFAPPAATLEGEEEPGPPGAAEARPGKEKAAAGDGDNGGVEEDRMDQLWEDFNEELAQRRARGRGGGLWSSEDSSDADSDSEPAALLARGCAPVLRPSSRAAGGAVHYRRRAGTWVLLMRIFRRLFVVEKTITAAAASARRDHHHRGTLVADARAAV